MVDGSASEGTPFGAYARQLDGRLNVGSDVAVEWSNSVEVSTTEAYEIGLEYLYQVRSLALEPGMIAIPEDLGDRTRLCHWIAPHITTINARLLHYLHQCHQCFRMEERREMRVFAAPIATAFGIDGCCNLNTTPITLLIDVGRVPFEHWLGLVVHEYAHAHAGHPGHDAPFVAALTQLCLGMGFPPLPYQASEEFWRSWPHCQSVTNPNSFWFGSYA